MKVVVIGASGQGKIAVDIIEKCGQHQIVGWIDSFKPQGAEVYGYEVLGTEDDLPMLVDRLGIAGGIIAIGINEVRHSLSGKIRELAPQFHFINAIHPSVEIARGAEIGEGVMIMAGSVLGADCKVGDFAALSTRSSLDHDGSLGAFAYFAPGVTTGGAARIGDFCFVGVGVSIKHNVTVGEQTVIGAGSTVVKDLPARVVAYGTPARVVRERNPGDRYL